MVRLRPRRQASVTGHHRGSHKLSKRYYGPFKVLDRIGPVAYKLELPDSSRIHPVFHVSMLKQFHQENTTPTHTLALPPVAVGNEPVISPLTILNTRYRLDSNQRILQVLVQWKGLLPEDATWEDWEALQAEYHLEDKVSFEGPGNDSQQAEYQSAEKQNYAANPNYAENRPKRKSSTPAYLKDYNLG